MSRPVHFCWDIWRAWQLFSGALYFTYFQSGIRVSCFFLFQPRWPHYFFTLALPSRPLFKNIKILSVFVFFKSPKVFSFLRSSGYRNLGLFIGAIVIVRWGEERREAGILRTWRRRSIWTRCRGARIFGISGTPISWAQFKPTLVVSSCSVSLIIGSFSDCFFFFFSFFFLGFCSFCLSTQLFSALSDRLVVFCGCLSADCCFAFWWWVLGSVVYFRFSVIQIWFCFYFGVLICLSYHDCCCEAMFYCLGWHGISQL